ncbi:hypothetical protein M514_06789 [Trichuris suis]|uniref:Uncharacterized protein n=1 Tax=Trichuris suis TaxID=68888 RepID=A0A085NKJ3_9BILA|nr:hypothetical protein M513_06789 [Trichuris suis]KFD69989.1 hypothetical protein M514_06789 [Trichuris suis]
MADLTMTTTDYYSYCNFLSWQLEEKEKALSNETGSLPRVSRQPKSVVVKSKTNQIHQVGGPPEFLSSSSFDLTTGRSR